MTRLLITCFFLLAGSVLAINANAEGNAPEAGQATASDHEIVSWRERYLEIGRDTYNWACAECHDEGKDAAPRIRDRDSWTNRSPLWSAVLLEHAKQGYVDMPAKGGHPYLSDRAVEAAGEYMLTETFPEKLQD